jgi:hypothetical protein
LTIPVFANWLFVNLLKISNMKNHPIFRLILILFLISGIYACSSDPTDKLIGTWRAVDVDAVFDEQLATPEMLKQVIQVEKQLFFKILNDSMMHIHTMDQTLKAYWFFDEESGRIDYRFAEAASPLSELGVYKDDAITTESQTALGKLTITYQKE